VQKNRMSKKAIRNILPRELVNWDVFYLPTCDSTQDFAAQLFKKHKRGGILVATNYQTRGRGRAARSWLSPRGKALLFSMILLPGHAPSHLHLLTVTAALAVCDTLSKHLNLKPEVKWPNDVLLGGKKVCGVLTELLKTKSQKSAVILGIGLNVNQSASALSPDFLHKATSLFLETGKTVPRIPLLGALMKSFEDYYFIFQRGAFHEIIRRWKSYSSMLGTRVTLLTGNKEVQGALIDLDDSGALVLRLDTGKTEAFYGSDCRFV